MASETPLPTVTATEYTVSCLPIDHIDRHHFEIKVAWRGPDQFAVMEGPYCLGADGDWEYEMQPSSRTDKWLAGHRFPLDEALALARDAAAEMTCNGHTVADALARSEVSR
jgi:hypothetical protein